MIFEEEKYTLGKRDIVLRSAHEDEADMLIDYVASYSEEADKLVNSDKESFYKHVQSKMDEDGYFFIHKSTGVVMCKADDERESR